MKVAKNAQELEIEEILISDVSPVVRRIPEAPQTIYNEGSAEAERAIITVTRKLKPSLSTEAVVNDLIREAMSAENLATIYCGKESSF